MMTQDVAVPARRDTLRRATAAICILAIARHPAVARTGGDADPTAPIQRLNATLLAAMKAGQATPFARRYAMLGPAIEQTFDLRTVLAMSVGPLWTGLPGPQRSDLAAAFQRYTIATYTANFDGYSGQNFRVAPSARSLGNGEVIVNSTLVRSDGSTVLLDYVMRDGPEGWKAVDVLTSGISRVAVQHSDFDALLSRGGAPALTAALQRKVEALSGGALA
jgi:phospholipid transport system substrate-binding protein